jgi:hypothetical protein
VWLMWTVSSFSSETLEEKYLEAGVNVRILKIFLSIFLLVLLPIMTKIDNIIRK